MVKSLILHALYILPQLMYCKEAMRGSDVRTLMHTFVGDDVIVTGFGKTDHIVSFEILKKLIPI